VLLAHRRLMHNAWPLVPVTVVVLLALFKAKQNDSRFPVCGKSILFVYDLCDILQLSV
jgi:hypothetical protein